MGLLCCAAKCCGCMALSQLCALLLPLGILAVLAALFYTYLIPWGEDQIRQALNLASDVDIGDLNASYIAENSCSGCVFGSNTQWPTNTTGTLHFLDSKAGETASGVIATSLAGAAVIGTGTMLWASAMPSAAAALSFSGGFYEMTHIVEQAQFVGMISQLRIEGAPTFLVQFSKELSWTNFNLIKSGSDSDDSSDGDERRLADSSASGTGFVAAAGQSGPARYAALIGVDEKDLFFYTLMTFAVVLAVIHVLYMILVLILGALAKNESFGDVARKWYRKVVWAGVLALLLAQYMFSMAGSYFVSQGSSSDSAEGSSGRFALGVVALAAVILLALGLGIIVVGNNTEELRDIGTYEHDQRAFSSKYSAYYDEYNFDNRFFFVPRILLAVLTGTIVGVVRDATTQLLCIMGITFVYLILLLIRQPNLLRFLYYIGITSVFMKVVLISLMLIVARDDYFPQSVRDNVAYGIIGVNMFIFFLLFVRQAYTIIHKMIVACRHKKDGKNSSSLDATDINLEFGNNASTARGYQQVDPTPANRGLDWYETKPEQFTQQQPPYHPQQHQSQPYQTQTSTISSYATTQSSRAPNNFDHVPMLEVAPDPVPAFSRSKGPVSRNQQYSFGGSSRDNDAFAANNAVPPSAPEAPVPTYDVLAAYLGTSKTKEEEAYATSPPKSSRGTKPLSSRGTKPLSSRGMKPLSSRGMAPLSDSRPSTVPLTASTGSFSGADSGASQHSSRRKRSFDMDSLHRDVDIDDVDVDGDFIVEPPAPGSARQQFAPGASTVRPQFNPGASTASLRYAPGASTTSTNASMEQSYVNFADSVVSTNSHIGVAQNNGKEDNSFSAALKAAPNANNGGFGSSPQAKMSIFSNDSDSFDGDSSGWFKRRSKTVTSVDESEGSEANDVEGKPSDGKTLPTAASAFTHRDSADSYGYQSTVNFASSHMDFNGQSQVSHNRLDQSLGESRLKQYLDDQESVSSMGADSESDDGGYYPSQRRGTGSSNQSFVSANSDDSMGFFVDRESDRNANFDRYSHSNTLTL